MSNKQTSKHYLNWDKVKNFKKVIVVQNQKKIHVPQVIFTDNQSTTKGILYFELQKKKEAITNNAPI